MMCMPRATPPQFVTVAICLSIVVVDGFDILSISFVAPAIADEWALTPIELGSVFSAGLAGMALGAFVLSSVGDILGRRTAIMIFLLVIGTGMLLTASADRLMTLSSYRLLTGLGIGALVSNTCTILVESVLPARRATFLGIVLLGTPVGALLSGSVALFLIDRGGWRAVFAAGGFLSLALIPVVLAGLREPAELPIDRSLRRRFRGPLVGHEAPRPSSRLPSDERARPAVD